MPDRQHYAPEGGKLIDSENGIYDETEHLKRNDWGQGGTMQVIGLLSSILEQQIKTNKYLEEITE